MQVALRLPMGPSAGGKNLVGIAFFPLAEQLRGYSPAKFRADVTAGLNVALLAFPQAIAFAMLAGLPIEYGVACAVAAPVVGAFFSRSRLVILGPTNATAAMLFSALMTLPAGVERDRAVGLLVFLAGGILAVGAFLRAGSLLKFVSQSVIIGYLTGAALLIIANQIPHLLGVRVESQGTLFSMLKESARSVGEAQWPALAVAAVTFAVLAGLRKFSRKLPVALLALVCGSLSGAVLEGAGFAPAMLQGLNFEGWRPALPDMNSQLLFWVAGPALAVAFLAALEGNVMARAVAARGREPVYLNQEMFSLGMANAVSALARGMPASGSLTRSALCMESGGVSALAGLFSGVMCLAGALVAGGLVAHVPKAALAALVSWVALSLIDLRRIRVALRATRSDAAVLLTTLMAALVVPLDVTIFLGVGVSIALFLNKVSSPELVEYGFNAEGQLGESAAPQRSNPHIAIIHVEGELFFGAADLFREEIRRIGHDPDLRVLILRMRNARHLDATSLLALEDLILSMRRNGKHLILSGASREVFRLLRNTGILKTLGRENLFLASPRNPTLATRYALKRAQVLLGEEQVEVKIYHDPRQEQKKPTDSPAGRSS